jgi:hypothetical protein
MIYKITRSIFFISLGLFSLQISAQFYSEANKKEASDMSAIINSFTFLELYKSDDDIIPNGYKKTFTSAVFGMDNKYQIYKKRTSAVINLRGSTAKKISWMENVYSSMVPANGEIKIENETFYYHFSDEEDAAVHSGYTLSIVLLSKDIINNIKALNYDGIYNIIITGHSQGGALAILLRAYLENLPKGILSEKNTFRTYAFANPKVGNQAFVDAYRRGCEAGTNYSIVNVKDLVPKMPLSYSEHRKMGVKESLTKLLFEESTSIKDIALGGLEKLFGGSIDHVVNFTSGSAFKQISKKIGKIEMPRQVEGAEYSVMLKRIELIPFDYPKILRDSSILNNDSLMTSYDRSENGDFIKESLYKKEPMLYQHKTYNYYTAFLKRFYPKKYEGIDVKVLPENL